MTQQQHDHTRSSSTNPNFRKFTQFQQWNATSQRMHNLHLPTGVASFHTAGGHRLFSTVVHSLVAHENLFFSSLPLRLEASGTLLLQHLPRVRTKPSRVVTIFCLNYFQQRELCIIINGYIFMPVTCLLRSRVHSQQPRLLRLFSSAAASYSSSSSSSALMLEYESPNFDPNFNAPAVHRTRKKELFRLVVRVFKCLNWWVAREKRFGSWVETHGFSHSINSFRIIIHTFALAGMRLEVFALLRDIVGYYNEANHDAFTLFSTLLDSPHHVERSVLVFDVLIKVFSSNSMLEHALDVFVSAKSIGLEPDIMSCNFLLKCLVEANRVEFARFLFERLKDSAPFPNIHTYTIMMNFYCRDVGCSADFKRAAEILGKIYRSGENPTLVTYGTYIRGLCIVGSVEVVRKLICKLKYRNQPLNNHCFNAVIYGFCQRGAICEALDVFEEMKNSGQFPDVYSYSILIDAFCKKGDVEKGLDLMKEMELCRIKPSIVTCTSLIRGLCKKKLMPSAKKIFDKTGDYGYKYDQTIYETLVDGFCRQGDMDSARELLKEMGSNNLAPSDFSSCSLIRGYYKLGLYIEALDVFGVMLQNGIWPDTMTCNHILSIYCRAGHFSEALTLSEDFHKHGVNLNPYSYNEFIHRLCKENYPKKALELLPIMLKRNLLPGVINYGTLISGFAKQSNYKKAVMLFTRMVKAGITFNVITYTVLINFFSRSCKMNKAYGIFKLMKDKGLYPDQMSYTTLIAGFCNARDMKNACALFEEMSREGCLPNVVTYTCLIDAFCKLNMIDMARWLFDDKMNTDKVIPDVVTYTVLITWYHKHGFIDQARKLYGKMKANGICPDDLTHKVLGLEAGEIQEG